MFMQAGSRPFWPVIVFLPWLVIVVVCLVYAATRRLHDSPRARARRLHLISILGLAFLAGARIVTADPAVDESRASHNCAAATAPEARALADRLYEKNEYQRAGDCYQAAGDLAHANLAFLKAAGPSSEDTARGLKQQRDAAKALFAGVARAFKGNH
jgi:glucose dehydrogenase